jgi:hypothetical protein
MRPRSVQTTPPSGTKKSRANYGENPSPPVKEKSATSARQAAETSRRNAPKASAKTISPEQIAERAHSIWEREGRPEGRDKEFWFRAEAELKNGRPGK